MLLVLGTEVPGVELLVSPACAMWRTGLLTSSFRRRWTKQYSHGGTEGRDHRVSGWWPGSRFGPPLGPPHSRRCCAGRCGCWGMRSGSSRSRDVMALPGLPHHPALRPRSPVLAAAPRDTRRAADLVLAARANRTRRLPARHGSGHASRRSPPPEPGRRALTLRGPTRASLPRARGSWPADRLSRGIEHFTGHAANSSPIRPIRSSNLRTAPRAAFASKVA